MMRSLILPRPLMLLANGLQFGGGVFFALLEGEAHPPKAESLWPSAAFVLFVLVCFLIQEFLVQQAKYMWNDMRDHEQDQAHPANRKRPLALQRINRKMSLILLGRWGLGLLLAWLLSPNLFILVLLISLLQLFYETAAKPLAGRFPLLSLFTVAISAVLKFSGGALAAGWDFGDQRFWFYGLAMFATGVVYVSSFWREEAEYFRQLKSVLPRGQSLYFEQSGIDWLKAGALVGVGACVLLLLDGLSQFLEETGAGILPVLLLISGMGMAICLLSFLIVSGQNKVGRVLVPAMFFSLVWFAGPHLGSIVFMLRSVAAALLFLILLLIDYRANYGMDYQQQNLIYLRENWPGWRGLWGERKRPFLLARRIWLLNTADGGAAKLS